MKLECYEGEVVSGVLGEASYEERERVRERVMRAMPADSDGAK